MALELDSVKAYFLEQLKISLTAELAKSLDLASIYFDAGVRDCKAGIYDKYYRYHTPNDGSAYDAGWISQNKETQNDKVQFLFV